MMSSTIFKPGKAKKHSVPITKFENNVLKLLCNKKSLKEVSEELGVSTHTIHAYQMSLYEKFQSKDLQILTNFCCSK